MVTKRTIVNIVALLAASLGVTYGDGTIQFANSASTGVAYCPIRSPPPGAFVFGVFVISSNSTETLVLPLGVNNTHTISASNGQAYPIPGTTEGQVVSLQIRGWGAQYGTNWVAAFWEGLFAATPVKQFTLGPPAGPGTVIWSSTDLNKFQALSFCYPFSPYFVLFDRKTVAEGTSGVAHVSFTVSLRSGLYSPPSFPILVDFATRSGTAIAGEDFVPTNGTLNFAYGETSQKITVAVTADPSPEADEEFYVVLSNPVHAQLESSAGTCVITEAHVLAVRIDGADTAVTFHTVAGRHYALEYSADLTTWTVVEAAGDITGAGGPMTIYDRGVGRSGTRYYRTRVATP